MKKKQTKKQDYFLIPSPKRQQMKISSKTRSSNTHYFVEFALFIFHYQLKRSYFDPKDVQQLQMLDPYVILLYNSLVSPHVKMVGLSLKVSHNNCFDNNIPVGIILIHLLFSFSLYHLSTIYRYWDFSSILNYHLLLNIFPVLPRVPLWYWMISAEPTKNWPNLAWNFWPR